MAKKVRGNFKERFKGGFSNFIKELLPGLDTTDYLAEARKAEKEGRKTKAAEFYAEYGNFKKAGELAEEQGDEELALRYYDNGYNPKSTFFRFIPAEPNDAGRIYEKKGMLREALDRYHQGGSSEDAGRVAEKLGYSKEALNYYKDTLTFLNRPKEKFRDTKRIKKIEEKLRNLETKLESNKKPLDSKITLFFAIFSFLISLSFLSFNITGNTILNIGKKSSNFLGLVFVLVGILAFYIQKQK